MKGLRATRCEGRGALKLLLLMALVVFVVAGCAGRQQLPSDLNAVYSPLDAQVSSADAGIGPGGGTGSTTGEPGDKVWWSDPETGEEGWITEGYATIGLGCNPEWILDPPADAAFYDGLFVSNTTIEALLAQGYELLYPYGVIMAGEFKLPPGVTFAQAAASLLSDYPEVAFVDPWGFKEPTGDYYPNDPWFYPESGPKEGIYQWYFKNWDYPYDVNAPGGWGINWGDPDTVVAVLDTGVHRQTPDLPSLRLTEWGWSIRGDFPPKDISDYFVEGGGTPVGPPEFEIPQWMWEHGTWVTSLMDAWTNNNFRMAGGTFCGRVFPVALQQIPPPWDEDMPDERITLSLYWLLDQVGLITIPGMDEYPRYNIKVVNMSMGGTTHNHSQTLIMWLLSWRTVVVVSAGNSGSDGNPYVYPAAGERFLADWFTTWRQDVALAVTAFDSQGGIAHVRGDDEVSYYDPESHEYEWVDVSAPGDHVLVLDPVRPDGWVTTSGTSFAAPLTSALAALMFSEHPYLSSWQIHDAIKTFTQNDPPLQDERLAPRIDYELALGLGNP